MNIYCVIFGDIPKYKILIWYLISYKVRSIKQSQLWKFQRFFWQVCNWGLERADLKWAFQTITICLITGQVGVKATFQVLMPEDSGSSPDTGTIINYYLTQEIFPPTPVESLPTLPRLLAELVTSVQSVTLSLVWQYAVWYQHATPRTRGSFQWW